MDRPSDVIVIGAGVIGCAVAYELSHRGASVEIIDDRPAGMGATQASAGILAPYIEAEAGGPLLDLTVRSLELFDSFLECVTATAGFPVPYRRTGTIEIALHPDTMTRLTALHGSLRSRGVPCDLLGADDVSEHEPQATREALGGLLIQSHGFVAVQEFTRALVAASRRRGARLLEQGRVRRISTSGRGTTVTTDRGSLTCDAVVIAGGSWSGQIAIDGTTVTAPVRPVRGQLLHLEWSGPPIRRVTWGEHKYLVPWDDGMLLVGATMEDAGFDERSTAAGVADLLAAAFQLVPNARSARFLGARAGLRPGTPDDLPIIGPSSISPGIVYATGHFRNGVLLSPLTAKLVADVMLEHRIDTALAVTAPGRFGL